MALTFTSPFSPYFLQVLDAGRIVEMDTPSELLSRGHGSLFYSMVEQLGKVELDHLTKLAANTTLKHRWVYKTVVNYCGLVSVSTTGLPMYFLLQHIHFMWYLKGTYIEGKSAHIQMSLYTKGQQK